MKAEQAKQLAETGITSLSAALEQGRSSTLTNYLTMMSRFRDYSFSNVMLIFTQMPDATRVAGFHTWRKLNRFVRKGEKGIVIIAPMVIKPKEDKPAAEDEERSLLRFKAVYVFDVSQTDGDPLPEFATVQGDPAGHAARLKDFIAAGGITLEYAEQLGGADGRSLGGRIQILTGLTAAEEFSVLTHELAHELMHRGERRSQTTKTMRETEAEAVAYVVGQAIGLTVGTHAADYIQLYDGNRETLAESLEQIQKTAVEIIVAVRGAPADEIQAA